MLLLSTTAVTNPVLQQQQLNNSFTISIFQNTFDTQPIAATTAVSSVLSSSCPKSNNNKIFMMCRAHHDKESAVFSGDVTSTAALSAAAARIGNFISRLTTGRRKFVLVLYVVLGLMAVSSLSFATLYVLNPGFRRTIQFWKGMAPIVIRYKLLKFKAKRIDGLDIEDKNTMGEYQRRLQAFRSKTAHELVDLILKLGGIYIKIGQVMATIGQGLFPEEYIRALEPLQNGVPPRSIQQISRIIEDSTGRRMEDIFVSFDEKPVGSASIAQAHKATLLRSQNDDGTPQTSKDVIVKVQYPEVAELFEADLNNLELATKWLAPENIGLAKALRERHQKELDFRIEAQNLEECRYNMQGHGVEPALVRIPRVRNETGLCTQHVLVMEYLEGTPLSQVIRQEQDRMAKAVGKVDANEFRTDLAKRMREHFEHGGGDGAGPGTGGMKSMLGVGGEGGMIQVTLPLLARLFRAYVGVKEGLDFVGKGVMKITDRLKIPVGRLKLEQSSSRTEKATSLFSSPPRSHRINVARVLKTLIYVHGIQMLKDGVYNADPHPGNVVVLPDGRVGLLDYGMVGRLNADEREAISRTVLALSASDKKETARQYREGGYRVTWKGGKAAHEDDSLLFRFATFHLDRIDLSPITMDNGEKVEMVEFFRTAREVTVPNWVEQGRRLGGLLQGVSAQAARPISLAKEWKPIASEALRQKAKKKR